MPSTKFHPPVDKMELDQPFGVNYVSPGYYSTLLDPYGFAKKEGHGVLDLHPGWDIRAREWDPLYAVMDGDLRFEDRGPEGKAMTLRNKDLGVEVVYGHIAGPVIPDGPVKAGMTIAQAGNTGHANGAHLHLGTRPFTFDASGAGPFFTDADNGYGGFVDPIIYFPDDIWYSRGREFVRPVDGGYGFNPKTKGVPSVGKMAAIEKDFKKTNGRELSDREAKAIRFGFWDLKTVLDPAMFPVWSKMSKPEALKRGIVKE